MITTLLLYVCLQYDATGCASEEVWAKRSWEGPGGAQRCDLIALEKNRQAVALQLPRRYECESSSVEADFDRTNWSF